MVVKSGGNWKRPVNRMYTYNFHWGELLPPDDQLPGGQEQPRCERGPARAPLLLREDLLPPAQWDEVPEYFTITENDPNHRQRGGVCRPVRGDDQEDPASH